MSLAEDVRRIEDANLARNSGYSEKKILLDNLVSDCYSDFRVRAEFRIDNTNTFGEYPLRTQFKPKPVIINNHSEYDYVHKDEYFRGYAIYIYELTKFLHFLSLISEKRIGTIRRPGMLDGEILECDEWHELVVFSELEAFESSLLFARKYRDLTGKKVEIIGNF